ncbi:M28 family peptidase [Streptosporangium sp. NPDC002544]|uniref:M28 family peptidase n=1 Tax=Streptosporangium sp. NPDC002544 TaxID=3154538 RepID=UPI00332ABB96
MKHKVLAAVTAGVATVASMALVAPPADAAPFHGALAGSLTPAASVSSTTAAPAADPKSLAVAAADRAVASGLDELRAGPDESYERAGVTTGPGGMQYVSYERTYRGLPVIGGDAVVVTDASGRVRDTTAASGPSPRNIPLVAKITAEQATQTAKARLSRVDDVGAPRLVVLAWGGKPKLAWEAVVAGVAKNKPSIQHVFVDARTGAVADYYDEVVAGSGNAHFAGQVTIDTSRVGSSYSMTDAGRPGIQCGGQNGSAYTKSTDTWGNGSGTDLETACVDVMYTAAQEWNMLRDWLGRNGIDGSGRGFGARVGMTDVNAYWTGTYTTFGRNQAGNKQLTSIDVVAHEYGHAIFQTTPGGAGSQSDNERGGLNESTGDIFGAITEAYASNPKEPLDYTVGQEVNLAGNGPIRYMYNPSKVGDPNCYSSSIPSTEVHAAAGPQNHWFYLLAEGSNPTNGQPTSPTCNSSTVTGIGIQKAGKIFMGALSRKSSTWKHSSVRSASVAAAVELFGANSAECASTKAAWSAVSVAAQSGEPTCTDPGPGSADFSLSLNPSSGSVQPGGQATATVGTQTTVGSAQTVNLTASGLPSGATASFTPSSVTSGGSATLTVSTTSATPTGTYQITVTGTGTGTGTPRHTATYTLTVGGGSGGTEPPDISVTNIKSHLQQFQTIATGNGGNRRSTGAGYTQSVSYLEQKLTAAGYTVTRQNCTSGCTAGAGPNLIADWPGGDTNQVIMAGAHLDGVAAGPGINDNGSGSGMLLEVALTLAAQKPSMAKHVRFGWWTDEEQGLNGSKFYVNSLSSTERSKIKAYLNYDMIGSTNAGYFINNITTATAANLKAYYDKLNLQPEENVEGQGRSDDASFKNAGIPTSGLAAGASATKTSAQAAKWGGTAGRAYDSCYHSACDTVSNVNDTVLGRAAGATAYALWKAAVGGDTPPPTRDFSLSLNPSSGSVQPGQQATATVATATTSGTAQTVSLSATVTPAGPTVSVTPTQVTSGGSATLTVSTSASTPAGTYSVTVTGGGETATRTATFTLIVNGPTGGDRTFTSTTVYSIPDNGYAFSPIQSTATGQASSPVQVALTVEHPCSETLSVYLMAPGSSDFITIKDQEFSTTCTPWSGSRTYQVPVSSTASGAWYLLVMDGSQDSRTGKLTGWSITL